MVVCAVFAVGVFDKANNNTAANNVRTPKNTAAARNFSAAGTVLLKNNGMLPIVGPVASGDKNSTSSEQLKRWLAHIG